MKLFTVQSRYVLDQVMETGIYYPDFEKSRYLELAPHLKPYFYFILENYNRENFDVCDGLVFSFAYSNGMQVKSFRDYSEFMAVAIKRRDAIRSLWDYLTDGDSVVLELDYDDNDMSNPFFIDINDYAALMPPVYTTLEYTEEVLTKLYEAFRIGRVPFPSVFPSYLVQAHTPYIKKENIVGVHPIFALE